MRNACLRQSQNSADTVTLRLAHSSVYQDLQLTISTRKSAGSTQGTGSNLKKIQDTHFADTHKPIKTKY